MQVGGMCGVDENPSPGLFLQPSSVSLFLDAGFPVYLYEFEHHTPTGVIIKPCTDGADHGDEIHFIFGNPFSKGATAPPDTLTGCLVSPPLYLDSPLHWLTLRV